MNKKLAHVASLERLHEITTLLGSDIRRCGVELNRLETEGAPIDQFWARALIRSFFALLEAMTYELKLLVRHAAREKLVTLSEGEQSLLSDEAFDLDETGRVVTRPRFLAVERNFRFIYLLAARIVDGPALSVSEARFEKFKRAVRVRNRITHPKSPDSVALSPEEVAELRVAVLWYTEAQQSLMDAWQRKLQSQMSST